MFAKVENGVVTQFPIYDIRKEFPSTLFPEVITKEALPSGYYFVKFDDIPTYDPNVSKIVQADLPVLENDVCLIKFTVVPLDEVELQNVTDSLFDFAKQERVNKITEVTVKVSSGKVFDGDEKSQDRMARAIVSLDPYETTTWILADNTVATVTREELREALRLSGQAQTQIWITPYTG